MTKRLPVVDISDCIDTKKKAKDRLLRIERLLATKLGLDPRSARAELFALDRAGKLVEDELVADWHDADSWYTHAFGKK